MSLNTTRFEPRAAEVSLTSRLAVAFIARVRARTGASETQARKVYLDYFRKTQASGHRRPRAVA